MRQIPIDPADNFGTLHATLAALGESLTDTLVGLTAGTVKPTPEPCGSDLCSKVNRGRSGFIVG